MTFLSKNFPEKYIRETIKIYMLFIISIFIDSPV